MARALPTSTRRVVACCRWVNSVLSVFNPCIITLVSVGCTLAVEDNELQGTLTVYNFALRAYERFLSECGSIPGECAVEQDIGRLKSIASKMLNDLGLHVSLSDDVLHEICRYGGTELHAVSAFIGKLLQLKREILLIYKFFGLQEAALHRRLSRSLPNNTSQSIIPLSIML